jgi:peroxiredoxin
MAHPCSRVLCRVGGIVPKAFAIRSWFAIWVMTLSMLCTAADTPAVGDLAPDFALPALQGGNVRLSEYRGQVVVLSFWGSRCAVCGAQLAALNELQTTYGSAGLVTLAVSIDDDMAKAREYALAHAAAVPLLLDARREVGRTYRIDRLPSTLLIDRNGRVRQWFRDFQRIDNSTISQVRALLDDAGSVTAQIH